MSLRRWMAFASGVLLALTTSGIGRVSETDLPESEVGWQADKEYWALVYDVVERTNEDRVQNGLPPLKLNNELCQAARWMAEDIGKHNSLSHTDSKGRALDKRLTEFRYVPWAILGENLAAGQQTAERVFNQWRNSPKHKENMLRKEFTEVGVGLARLPDSPYKIYWIQTFGARKDHYPIVINNESLQTQQKQVDVFVYGEGWAKSIRWSLDGKNWSNWAPYTNRLTVDLEPTEGVQSLYIELKNGSKTLSARDTIWLQQATASAK